jgi:hypothetical protein
VATISAEPQPEIVAAQKSLLAVDLAFFFLPKSHFLSATRVFNPAKTGS